MPRRRHRPPPMPATLDGHLRQIRKELPNIRPFAEEDDLNWWNDGLDAMRANQLQRAEKIFKKLVVAQPEHFDGYYGLAQVYQHQRLISQAILFADEALRLAQPFLEDGSLEPIGMQQLKDFRAQIGLATGSVT